MKYILLAFTFMFLSTSCGSKKEMIDSNVEDTQVQKRGDRKGPRHDDDSLVQRRNASELFKMDANGDNQLSKSEVQGRLLKDFDRFDMDNDGFISKEEIEKAPRPKKGERGGRGGRN